MSYTYLLLENSEGVTTLTLNRPDKLNALNNEMMLEIRDALHRIKDDSATRVLVLRGAGKAFCTGADLSGFKAEEDEMEAINRRASLTMEVNAMFHKLGKPVIASVHRYALAGGCGLAMAADMVIAADDAVFGYPEIQRGFVAALVMTNLIRLVGRRNAFDLLITGRKIDAREALKMGMVNKVVPREELDKETMALAKELAALSPTAARMTKNLFYRVAEMNVNDALETARETNILMRLTGDFKKGVDEFVNKRSRDGGEGS